ncbi:hypothetical protein HOT29_gp008 [Microbacterium phage Squash]|uniref:Uncharacterized protein n=1 Tax=Microbacterium phage Squash TaxID=2182357 RepID=A0A2U8ULP5_9CAUD|nr:hypothetical protein HOT29_gp008 [Microbacterium phage Squash]AWN04627.1 hypothetical protein PBI_SQUASH_8 [Microbacterium phage Squash]QIQ63592.1 hypothetical protein SEA_NIKE_7 [Microbacterium phage Nike]
MTELKPLKITLYARIGDSEVLNEIAGGWPPAPVADPDAFKETGR